MGNNTFGRYFAVTTFGESHGKAIGCVVDGCPAGVALDEADIAEALAARRPGQTPWTSPRKELDIPRILSGLFEGKTTGAPIAILIENMDIDSSKYASIADLIRPGHANATYQYKYGVFDWRGGGRASGRETACRVAAGAIAKKLLQGFSIHAYLKTLGSVEIENIDLEHLKKSPIFCPDPFAEKAMIAHLEAVHAEGDSLGGIVEVRASIPAGLGDPLYGKLEALLASAMLSIPACRGFEIGAGFAAARMRGSEHNDEPQAFANSLKTATNHAGGVLGGISTGMPLVFRVPFKPTSSVAKPQKTVNLRGERCTFELPKGSRHDPALSIRAVSVVEAMTALVLADCLLAPSATLNPGSTHSFTLTTNNT